MIKQLVVILTMILIAGAAQAQLLYGISQSTTAGGNAIPPVCNNSLDFSQACNSQYFAVIR